MYLIIFFAVAGLVTFPLPASAQPDWGPWRMHDWMGWGSGWGGMIFGPLMMIVWLAFLVAVVVLIARWLGGSEPSGVKPERTAREILDERYARGEVDREDYFRRRQDIDGPQVGTSV